MRTKIMGRIWRLRFVANLAAFGDCDPYDKPNKQIRISSALTGKKKLEIVLHELTHAADWHLDEEFVSQFSEDVAHVLWRLGYRDQEE